MIKDTSALLVNQYYHEIANSLKYQIFANQALLNGLTGVEKFLQSQAKGEFDHAQKVVEYLKDRFIPLSISATDTSGIEILPEFDLKIVFEKILEIEQETTRLLKEIYTTAFESGDYLTTQWLIDPAGLLKEQIEEEFTITLIINRIIDRQKDDKAIGGINYDIDLWIDQEFNK